MLCATVLAFGGMAAAAEPSGSSGAAMLEALRHRDAGQRWEAAGEALAPIPQDVPPVVESIFASDSEANGPAWRRSRESAPGRAAVTLPAPTRIAVQDEPRRPYEEPLAPIPMDEADPDGSIDPTVMPVAKTPAELRKINDILPYFDYEPDPDVDDPCLYLCPRPDGLPCKQYGEGEYVPACPDEVALGDGPFVPRMMPPSVFAWTASNISYNPLYFEDVQLERYGHTYGECVQPFVSLGKFSAQLIGLPYQMALDPPCKEVYPLGYYRPGEPAPKLFYQVPLNAKAAVIAAGVYTGIGVVLP
ncbi:MAG: hypothetical protein M3552_11840 [Planctomycetota bacterium]|nr:hypothetical protein [Planctomycetaceae bacterium]MDQ3331325.1 hypothetical protein [Planctomycetota bacterium]